MISIIVPCFNQEVILGNYSDNMVQLINALDRSAEFVFVDDGSSDNTIGQLQKISQSVNAKFTIVRLQGNYGQHNATMAGLSNAQGDILVTIDLDKLLAGTLKQLLRVIQNNAGLPEVTYGINTHKNQSLFRSMVGQVFALSFRILFPRVKYVSSTRIITLPLATRILSDPHNFVIIDAIINAKAKSFGTFSYEAADLNAPSVYKLSKLIKLAQGLYIIYRPMLLLLLFIALAIIAGMLINSGYILAAAFVAVLLILFAAAFIFTWQGITSRYKEKYKVAELICN